MEKNEPAFPVSFGQWPSTGLTKREYFAALIMSNRPIGNDKALMPQFAKEAVDAAEALIEALNKKP